MESIAPPSFAESWDRVGLHVGRGSATLRGPVLLTIDLTESVMAEAERLKAGAIVSYHPVIWEPLARITDATAKERVVLRAAEQEIAIYCPHTALDAVSGGLADWLCEGLSGGKDGKIAGDCRALKPHAHLAATQQVKVVTFVPEAEAEKVRLAMATAGAGIIADYTVCSFSTAGTGTFLAGESADPKVGKRGRLESVSELRLEMVCSRAALALVLETLKRFHPYETPAVDVYELLAPPTRGAGSGRRLMLDKPATIEELSSRLKKIIARPTVRVATPDLKKRVSVVGVCPGSGSELASLASCEGCEVYVTGEMKHHEVTKALDAGLSIILGGHTSTERGFLPRLARMIESRVPGIKAIVSKADSDPLLSV
jgi:dinuclear metal center YbgI/SA1388 family protein